MTATKLTEGRGLRARLADSRRYAGSIGKHGFLITYTLIVLGPIALIFMDSFKSRTALFTDPVGLPIGDSFSTIGYETVFASGNILVHFYNSMFVTVGTLALVLLSGSMAAYALGTSRFRGNRLISLYLFVGIMIPIRLGTVSVLQMMSSLGLINTLPALVLVYTAQSLPIAAFVLTQFMREVPRELMDAARADGASYYRIYRLLLPLVAPGMATAAALTLIPVWNDLWWPLILAPGTDTQTMTLWAQQFLGEYTQDWNATLAALTMAALPAIALYALMSRQLIRGLMRGALK